VKRLSDQSATEVVAGHELVVASDGELVVAALPPVDGTTGVVPDGSAVANAPQGPPLKIGLNIGKGGVISGTAGNQPATLRGRVLDATGQPWPNAQVSIYDNENARDAVAEATTDADGRFEIKARVDGEVFVRVGTVIEAKDVAEPGKETNFGDLAPDAK
ncbi:MAG: carboxypeptidase-like regulatory domain-containing protein, partial [Opitutales bacterium]